MDHQPTDLRDLLIDVAPGIDLSFRSMFGGIMGYAGGVVFASLSNVGLGIKLPKADQAGLIALGGDPLRYEPDSPPSKSYVVVPAAMLADRAALATWVARSIAGLAPAKPRARR